jgi:hypothetical protein
MMQCTASRTVAIVSIPVSSRGARATPEPMLNNTFISRRVFLVASAALAAPALAQSFDHNHSAWTELLRRHVVLLDSGRASQLRYSAMASNRPALKNYLATLSAITQSQFDGFDKPQQMAFLINAYNAFTVELVLTQYPKLSSIKDLGSIFKSPWKLEFVPLLGGMLSLDAIEHGVLRARGRFDDPRVHFAVNCASVGCPALREEAFVAERLDAQLEAQTRRFMSDRSRNRWSTQKQGLEISKIFDWYGEDFRLGHKGIATLAGFCARYADQLADTAPERERIRSQVVDIAYLPYDWKLNDVR